MHECSIAAHAICVRTTMPSLCSVLNFLRSRLTRKHNASFSYVLDRVASIRVQKYKKSVICHSTITDFILIYSCIPLFCLGFGIPIASLNSFIFFLNQLICDTSINLEIELSIFILFNGADGTLGFKALVELGRM